jgi:WXG100 family type VII secretion target
MHEIGMNPDEVKQIAQEVATHHINIQDTLVALRNLNDRLSTAWSGEAKAEFEITYGNWITQLQNYSETLDCW